MTKKLFVHILLGCLICLPTVGVIVFQLTQGIFSIVNLIILAMAVLLFFAAVKTGKSKEGSSFKISGDGSPSSNFFFKKGIVAKIICIALVALFSFLAWLSYTNIVKKYENRHFAYYEAEVIGFQDESFSESYYDTDGTFTTTEYNQCNVMFKYFDGDNYRTVNKLFKGITLFTTENIGIYVINDEVVATEHVILGGKVLTGALIALAIISLLMAIFNFNIVMIIFVTLFCSSGLAFIISMSIYPLAALCLGYSGILSLLVSVGIFMFIFGIYDFFQERKNNSFI